MADDLRIRPADEGDTDGILELLKLSLGEGSIPRDEAYWSWKHVENPFGPSPALVAEADGRIVGLRVFMRWTWERDGEEVRAVRAVDTATHPDWQGRGIFTRLTLGLVERMEEEGVEFVFNTPNRYSRPGYLKMGWSAVGRTSLCVRPQRPLRLIRTMATREAEPDVGPRNETPLQGFSLAEQLERPELDRVIGSRAADSRLSTRVSRTYLRWRYEQIPGFTYHAAGSWQAGEEALVVFRLRSRNGLAEVRLCEILTAAGRAAERRAASLVRRAIRATGPDYVAAMAAAGTPARRAVLRAGFLPAPRLGPILTVRSLSRNRTDLTDRSSWRLTIGDLELF